MGRRTEWPYWPREIWLSGRVARIPWSGWPVPARIQRGRRLWRAVGWVGGRMAYREIRNWRRTQRWPGEMRQRVPQLPHG